MTPTIILLRHGETHWNREGRIQGEGDSPLTLKGIAQARAYGERLKGLVGDGAGWALVSSPMPRCLQTAAILCEVAGLDFTRLTQDERLREIRTGEFSGLLKEDIRRRHPELMAAQGLASWMFNCPGGETHGDISARLSSWLAERKAGEKLIAVAHGVSGKILRGLYAGLAPEQALTEDSPQDALFLLAGGTVERVEC